MATIRSILTGFLSGLDGSGDRLTNDVVAEFNRRGIEATDFDKAAWTFRVQVGKHECTVATKHLHHAVAMNDRSERARLIARFVDGVLTPPMEWKHVDEIAARLMPLVRSRVEIARGLLSDGSLANLDKSQGSAWRPFVGDLVMMLGIDRPDSIQIVSNWELQQTGTAFEAAWQIAAENFAAQLSPLTFEQLNADGNAFFTGSAEDYQSSILTASPEEFLGGLSFAGDPVILIPARNQLFVTGSQEPSGLVALARIAATGAGDLPHPCSFQLLTHNGHRWVEFEPDPDTEAGFIYARSRRLNAKSDYDEQAALLEKIYQAASWDVHIAEYMVFERDNHVESVATWVNGVTDGLLPVADSLAFVTTAREASEDDELVVVPWNEAFAAFGSILQEVPNLYPPRYRYTTFPTEEQLARFKVDKA